eukprot:742676-Hanusia_phi.AAC.1
MIGLPGRGQARRTVPVTAACGSLALGPRPPRPRPQYRRTPGPGSTAGRGTGTGHRVRDSARPGPALRAA